METTISFLLSLLMVALYANNVIGNETTEVNLFDEKCDFKNTVNLTGYEPLENGSYIYQDILIPNDKLANYNYSLKFRDKVKTVDLHLRGCVCGNSKYCIKLCCEGGEFFNETSAECEPISEDLDMPTHMDVVFKNGNKKTLNISENFIYQVGTPCKYPESLTRGGDKWNILEDGILHILRDNARLDTVSYCLTPYLFDGADGNVLVPMSCPIKYEVSTSMEWNTYAMAISVAFFIPTILVYLFLRELRSTMSGKLLICYLIALSIGYSTISFINISEIIFKEEICTALGFSGYYFFMAAFLWLNVLCIDIWYNFREHSIEFSARKNRLRFIWYSIYAWGLALIMTLSAIWTQNSELVEEIYKPGIGAEYCWLNTEVWSAAIFFYGPNLVILIFNIFTFIHLASKIYRVRRDVAKLTQKQKFIQENAIVIVRLFIIMGISWIMDIISYCLRDYPQYEFLFMLTDFCNAIQGVLIFILFVLKPSVIKAIQKCCSPPRTRKPRPSVTSITTQFSKLSTSSTANP